MGAESNPGLLCLFTDDSPQPETWGEAVKGSNYLEHDFSSSELSILFVSASPCSHPLSLSHLVAEPAARSEAPYISKMVTKLISNSILRTVSR